VEEERLAIGPTSQSFFCASIIDCWPSWRFLNFSVGEKERAEFGLSALDAADFCGMVQTRVTVSGGKPEAFWPECLTAKRL
jgi:hypothetical protein